MRRGDFDLRGGKVVYWDLDGVALDASIADQLGELKEDLGLVEFGDNVILDIGWYPSFSLDGSFLVQVIRNRNWEEPHHRERCRTLPALVLAVQNAIAIADAIERRG